MRANKVIIIGAGCAGLSAAYTLHKQGVEALVYEASPFAGGRCRTVYEDGFEFFVGAGSTEPQWSTTFQYLEELGLLDRLLPTQKLRYGILRNGKVRTIFTGGDRWETLRALPETLAFLFTAIPLKTYPQLIKVFSALSKHMKRVDTRNHNFDSLAEISMMSAEAFALQHGGPEAVEWFFHPFLSTMVLGRPREISIAHPIALFSLMQGMCTLDGGMGILTAGLYERVKDQVRLNTPVQKVVIQDGKVAGVVTPDGFTEAGHVICALDAVDALQVIPDLPETMRAPLATCNYSSTYYYQFGLEEPLIQRKDTPAYIVMLPPGADTILAFASLGHLSRTHPIVVAATRGWEDDRLARLSPEARRRLVISDLQTIHPAFPDEPKATKVFRWDRAVNLESPGQLVAIRNLIENHMHDVRGLYLAGEYLFLIASTEGAFATGKQAAERVLAELRNERL